jgi:RHS repeat-associated protein
MTAQEFSGKERDSETNLDYFGARYFSGAQGRFTSADPLMASAKARNPQSWNRYAYTLNNPLRYVDPDGMEVPEGCAKDSNCTIKLKLNVIYDQDMNGRTGPTPMEKNRAQALQAEATSVLANANIQVETALGQGSYTEPNERVTLTGLVDDRLNIVFSNTTPSRTHAGNSDLYDGKPVSIVNVNAASSGIFVSGFWSPTLLHEEGHAFRGDLGNPSGFFRIMAADFQIDTVNFGVTLKDASSIQTLREEVANKRYAVPASPEANKPK